MAATPADDKLARRQRFLDVFPGLVDDLLDYMRGEKMPVEAVEWYRRNLEANTPGGKLNRGLSVVDTTEILLCTGPDGKRSSQLTDEQYHSAAVLGWCVELLQAYFLVADDMMDQSITRRGQPCWYRVKEVGNIAINDSFMLEAAIYYLLKKYFRSHPAYGLLLELFHETTFQTELGQLIDLITAPEDHVDLDKFSLEKHHLIVVYKTAYYSFYLPVALAMRYAGITDEALYKQALDILLPLGEYFQVQDDYLDCYGDPEVIGKIGTDIQDNKCSWLINYAKSVCNDEQLSTLKSSYGRKNDAEAEARVKAVFNELKVAQAFEKYEKERYDEIMGKIGELKEESGSGNAPGLRKEVFVSFVEKVYKRSK